jgi:hypothetical protein
MIISTDLVPRWGTLRALARDRITFRGTTSLFQVEGQSEIARRRVHGRVAVSFSVHGGRVAAIPESARLMLEPEGTR